MPAADVLTASVTAAPSKSIRARQLQSAFDVPDGPHQTRSWTVIAPLAERDWNVGLIVGPSGSGKTTLLHQLGTPSELNWSGQSVVDDFDPRLSISDITAACSAVGFNTIPAWLRPYATLSNGEQFRVGLARLIAEADHDQLVVIDEFTSVVDRQVAKIASQALSKFIRRRGSRVVVASCHEDIIDWLQPDWVIEPAIQSFNWRSVQSRPKIDIEIGACEFAEWNRFAPYHYLTADLNKAARTFAAYVDGQAVSFTAVLARPVSRSKRTGQNLRGFSRVVTLPDWQGLGIAMRLMGTVAAAYKAMNFRSNTYPAHPSLIRSFDRSDDWAIIAKPGFAQSQRGGTDRGRRKDTAGAAAWKAGARPCATFRYVGPPLGLTDARQLLAPYLRT